MLAIGVFVSLIPKSANAENWKKTVINPCTGREELLTPAQRKELSLYKTVSFDCSNPQSNYDKVYPIPTQRIVQSHNNTTINNIIDVSLVDKHKTDCFRGGGVRLDYNPRIGYMCMFQNNTQHNQYNQHNQHNFYRAQQQKIRSFRNARGYYDNNNYNRRVPVYPLNNNGRVGSYVGEIIKHTFETAVTQTAGTLGNNLGNELSRSWGWE